MHHRDRQRLALAFKFLQRVDIAAHGRARCMHHGDHFAIDYGGHGPHFAAHHGGAEVHQFIGAIEHIGMRILLERNQQIAVVQHGR
ncbi:hypothetical protein D3C85_1731650 [compost metagenome]